MTAKAFRTIWDLKSEKNPTLKCPRDHSDLHLFFYKEIELDFCMECKGLWFDALEMESFTNLEDVERAKSIKYSSSHGGGSAIAGEVLGLLAFEALAGILAGG
jgi:Zn-finger nucleic acid-binding protein